MKIVVERGRGECYQWKAAGQCSKGDNCSFRHDGNQSGKPTPKSSLLSCKKIKESQRPSGRFPRKPCWDILKGTCMTPSKWYFGIPPHGRFTRNHRGADSTKMSAFHQQVEGQPRKKLRRNDDNSAVALWKNSRQFGLCIPLRKGTQVLKLPRKVKFSLLCAASH